MESWLMIMLKVSRINSFVSLSHELKSSALIPFGSVAFPFFGDCSITAKEFGDAYLVPRGASTVGLVSRKALKCECHCPFHQCVGINGERHVVLR